LKEAHRLLVETTLPIQQIALRVGYPQATNFTTAFRERFGVSPRQLRREPKGPGDG
jgi:transcriptional regulator GlxA family with amidase domain